MPGFSFSSLPLLGALSNSDYLVAPFSASQDSYRMRTSIPPDRPVVDLATMAGQAGWIREVNAVYDGGSGCYISSNGNGYIVKIKATNFRLEGIMNTFGGPFSVSIDGVAAGTGTCYAATTTRGTYYQASGLSDTIHTVIVLKTGGNVLFLDTVTAV